MRSFTTRLARGGLALALAVSLVLPSAAFAAPGIDSEQMTAETTAVVPTSAGVVTATITAADWQEGDSPFTIIATSAEDETNAHTFEVSPGMAAELADLTTGSWTLQVLQLDSAHGSWVASQETVLELDTEDKEVSFAPQFVAISTPTGNEDDDVAPTVESIITPFASGENTDLGGSNYFSIENVGAFGVYESDGKGLPGNFYTETATGRIAYCGDHGRQFSDSTEYSHSWDPRLMYWIIQLNGYPATTNIGGTWFSNDDARAVTQLAIWAVKTDATSGYALNLDTCYTTTDVGASILAAAKYLVGKAYSNPNYLLFMSRDELSNYMNILTISGSDTTGSVQGDVRVFGPYSATSDLDTASLVASTSNLPFGTYFSDSLGSDIGTPIINSTFYLSIPSSAFDEKVSGSLSLKTQRLDTAALFWGCDNSISQDELVVGDPQTERGYTSFSLNFTPVTVTKLDDKTGEPVSDTEYRLYQQQTADGSWVEVASGVTDEAGKLFLGGQVPGNYKVTEVRPNPDYSLGSEFDAEDTQFFTITAESTEEVQVFDNKAIQLSCDVYKHTIDVTSSALDATEYGLTSNVGAEEYLYQLGARSTSNVRADEFVITDPLELVQDYGYRLTTIWTGTSPEGADFDGLMSVVYQTNKTTPTDTTGLTSDDVLSTGFDNPNNPDGDLTWSLEDGWELWESDLSTTESSRLDVSDLNLDADEYVTAIKMVYGDVDRGFYTGEEWTMGEDDQWYNADYDGAQCTDWVYAVRATKALSPYAADGSETVLANTVSADIARNWNTTAAEAVLTDAAVDNVETRVIDSFAYSYADNGRTSSGMAKTGDTPWPLIAVGIALVVGTGVLTISLLRRRKVRGR